MFLNLISSNFAIAIAWIAAILFSLSVHEFSHALIGKFRGDKTAEREGRLTLNPLSHVDPWGFLFLILLGFGWAKPVPFNPYNLKNPKWDSVAIALAGPASNLLLAFLSAVILRTLVGAEIITSLNLLVIFLFLMILLNLFLMFFNVIPVHPLDGSKLVFALLDHPKHARLRQTIAQQGQLILTLMVLISIFTPIDVFFFITGPSFAVCDAMLGESCLGFFSAIFTF